MSQDKNSDLAIVGAGLAGAACARVARAAGLSCILYDKGRGPGGRLSSRRAETPAGEVRIDHGAQYLTARTASFQNLMRDAASAGLAASWEARLVSIDRAGTSLDLKPETRWVGIPGMNGIVRHALSDLDVQFHTRIQSIKGKPGAWMLKCEEGRKLGPFKAVALTIPPEQLVDLLARSDGEFSDMIVEARDTVMSPCQAVMLVLDQDFDPGFEGAKLLGGGIRWMANMSSRPKRPALSSWILHASPDWSRAHLEDEPEDVARQLYEQAYVRFGMPRPVWMKAHRWLYALAESTPGTPCYLDERQNVGCAGDWRLGPRAELAWTSGEALGERLVRALQSRS